jgi:hypothetical protein
MEYTDDNEAHLVPEVLAYAKRKGSAVADIDFTRASSFVKLSPKVVASLLFISCHSLTIASDDLPTPFVRLTGAYLASAYAIADFAKTKCGYAITYDAQASLRGAESEIFNAFPAKYHSDLRQAIPSAKTTAKELVQKALNAVPPSKLDFKTRCGISSGMLSHEFARNRLEWRDAKAALSTKR